MSPCKDSFLQLPCMFHIFPKILMLTNESCPPYRQRLRRYQFYVLPYSSPLFFNYRVFLPRSFPRPRAIGRFVGINCFREIKPSSWLCLAYLIGFSRIHDEQYHQHDGRYHSSRAIIHLHGSEYAGQCDQKNGTNHSPQILTLSPVELDAAD